MTYRGHPNRRAPEARRGFTLVEVLITSVILGLGITAILSAMGSGTQVNDAGVKISQSVFLAQEIREWTVNLPFDSVEDMGGNTYSPSRNSMGESISGYDGYSQSITVTWRDPDSPGSLVASGGSDLIHVRVDILYNGENVLTTGWLVAGDDEE